MTTIVFSHPWHGSFNKAVLDTVTQTLAGLQEPYHVIDLHQDKFDPVLGQPDLEVFSKGHHADPLVGKYQQILLKSDKIILVFPIWWFSPPAMVKGFWDKVMLKNFAYTQTENGLEGQLDNIRQALVLTTSNSPTQFIRQEAGNAIEGTFFNGQLAQVGIQNPRWINCSDTQPGKDEQRAEYLAMLEQELREMYAQ